MGRREFSIIQSPKLVRTLIVVVLELDMLFVFTLVFYFVLVFGNSGRVPPQERPKSHVAVPLGSRPQRPSGTRSPNAGLSALPALHRGGHRKRSAAAT